MMQHINFMQAVKFWTESDRQIIFWGMSEFVSGQADECNFIIFQYVIIYSST